MKIASIRLHRFEAPLQTPFVTALRRVETLEDTIVAIEDEEGRIGYGEGAAVMPVTGESSASIRAAIRYLTPHLIGREVENVERLFAHIDKLLAHNTTVKAMLSSALYDLLAQREGLPLYRYLNPHVQHATLHSDITLSLGDAKSTETALSGALRRGFKALKVKLGADIETEKARIRSLFKHLPAGVSVRLDANQAYDSDSTIDLLQSLEAEGIVCECIEQPIPAEDFEGLKQIKRSCNTPLLADESAFSLRDARILFEMDAVDAINIKLAKCGGIHEALKLLALCKNYGKKAMVGCMLEGPVAIAAAAHLAAASDDTVTMVDLDAVALLSKQPLPTRMSFNNGSITLNNDAGLGIALEPPDK